MRHPAKFREDRYQNPFRGFGAPGCQNLAFQRWPFPLLWLFAFTTFAFLPLQIRVPVTEIRRISSFYVRSCYFLKIMTQKCKQKFCLLRMVDVADARSVLCDKRILERVCLNSICNSSRCSAEKVRRFIGECANMHANAVRVITQKTSFAGERRLSPAKDVFRRRKTSKDVFRRRKTSHVFRRRKTAKYVFRQRKTSFAGERRFAPAKHVDRGTIPHEYVVLARLVFPLPLPLSSAVDFRPLRPFGCSLVCHHKKSSGSNV